ncbi:MAG: 1-acyl-sn-glycerol-3-phosphate acyltransferase [Woeseiaceae bacterium]|nr:1-acyl-sn-glycerol-3-phosphate acyltransferase [Woeseiaceae bacterium]
MQRPSRVGSTRLRRLVDAGVLHREQGLLLVPVAIYWGRSPDKERSWFKLLFSENWDVAGRTRKLFATLLHGRNTLLRFSEPVALHAIVQEQTEAELAWRKVARILRVHFRQRRAATLGPDLSHRRTLVNVVLRDPQVRRIIGAEAARPGRNRSGSGKGRAQVRARDRRAHLLPDDPHRRAFSRLALEPHLRWHRAASRGLAGFGRRGKGDRLRAVPPQPFRLPAARLRRLPPGPEHSARRGRHQPEPAGGRLDPAARRRVLPLRRSFKGNRLYAAVFSAYLHQILARGHAIEYFVEGGRSRTGRLLTPKAGMLAMTVHSYTQYPRRPVVFAPVYFGYEKLIEGDSFISELRGEEKKKESLLGLIRSVRALRDRFGKVYVNVGQPIDIEALLDEARPDWRESVRPGEDRPTWMNAVVDDLGARIMTGINAAAAVTPISLLATTVLSTPKQSMGEFELMRQIDLSRELLGRFRYSESVTLPDWPAADIISHGVKLGVIRRAEHPLGDVIWMPERQAVLMTYFRNNVQHLFAVPASIACCFIQGQRLHTRNCSGSCG